MARSNLHATGLIIGSRGLLITGRSGAGKSTLALALMDFCHAHSVHAALIADDRVWVEPSHDRLIAEAPDLIAGLVEIYGHRPSPVRFQRRAVIDRIVTLVDPADAPRYYEDAETVISGIALPRIMLAERNARGAVLAISSWLGLDLL